MGACVGRGPAWISRGRRPVAVAGGFGEDRPESSQEDGMTSSGTDSYTVANREDAIDFMADFAEYGEQRW
jgi:hypothetical protein